MKYQWLILAAASHWSDVHLAWHNALALRALGIVDDLSMARLKFLVASADSMMVRLGSLCGCDYHDAIAMVKSIRRNRRRSSLV